MEDITDFEIIHNAVCQHFKLSKSKLFSNTRKKEVIIARQFFQYFARILNPEYVVTSSDIAKYYCDILKRKPFDHATILHSVKTIKGYVDSYDSFRIIEKKILSDIKNKINNKKYYNNISPLEIMQNAELIANL